MNDKTIQNWLSLSKYDFDTAEAMLKTGRYLYVAFTCQQSIEKMLKAIYVKEKNSTPIYSHNLLRLAEPLTLWNDLSDSNRDFLGKLNSYYIQSRYTEEINELSMAVTEEIAKLIQTKTGELLQWLTLKI